MRIVQIKLQIQKLPTNQIVIIGSPVVVVYENSSHAFLFNDIFKENI